MREPRHAQRQVCRGKQQDLRSRRHLSAGAHRGVLSDWESVRVSQPSAEPPQDVLLDPLENSTLRDNSQGEVSPVGPTWGPCWPLEPSLGHMLTSLDRKPGRMGTVHVISCSWGAVGLGVPHDDVFWICYCFLLSHSFVRLWRLCWYSDSSLGPHITPWRRWGAGNEKMCQPNLPVNGASLVFKTCLNLPYHVTRLYWDARFIHRNSRQKRSAASSGTYYHNF